MCIKKIQEKSQIMLNKNRYCSNTRLKNLSFQKYTSCMCQLCKEKSFSQKVLWDMALFRSSLHTIFWYVATQKGLESNSGPFSGGI